MPELTVTEWLFTTNFRVRLGECARVGKVFTIYAVKHL